MPCSILLRMRNVSDRSCRESQNAHFMLIFFFVISYLLWDIVGKYCRAGQTTDDNMAHAHCTLHTYGYKRTLTVRNTYCFSTATTVARTRIFVTLYVRCPSCCLSLRIGLFLKSCYFFFLGIPSPKWLQCCCIWLWDKCSVLDLFPLQLAEFFIPCELTRN
jgi:hypothetical protein